METPLSTEILLQVIRVFWTDANDVFLQDREFGIFKTIAFTQTVTFCSLYVYLYDSTIFQSIEEFVFVTMQKKLN